MNVTTRSPREEDVANHHYLLGFGRNSLETEAGADDPLVHHPAMRERRLLAMIDDGNPECSGVLERRAHEVRAHDWPSIVAHRHSSRANHLAEFSERFTALSNRDRADRMHARRTRATSLTDYESDGSLIVGYGIGVRHRAHRSESTRGRSARAARNCLDVFPSRLAQMRVYIDESGGNNPTGTIDDLSVIRSLDASTDRFDYSTGNENVAVFVEILR